MSKDALRSSMRDNVVTGNPLGGTRLEKFDIEQKPSPDLKSAQAGVAFNANMDSVDADIPGGLMTCLDPEETGKGTMESAFGTPPISK